MMSSETTLINLLHNINIIRKKHEEFAKITGENFNIFSVLKIEASEVRLHSAFLGELLNPDGSHGQNDAFLKLFLEHTGVSDLDFARATVEVEKHIGAVTETEGGRVDILITSGPNTIIIENKIYASDQVNQLSRYYNFRPRAKIFYLTLDGAKPTIGSINNIPINYFTPLSYQNDIITWLEACRKESVTHSILRETITQYINLIKKLTNQSTNVNMEKEIHKTLLNDESAFKTAELIGLQITKLKTDIINMCWADLIKEWKDYYKTSDRELIFFSFKGFDFIIRPGLDEGLLFHFYPSKDNKFGIANDSEIPQIFRANF